jgi:hypothetical protein
VQDVVDERAAKNLGTGRRFSFDFNGVEAIFLSCSGAPPRL